MTTNESNYIDENKNPIETEDFAKALAAEEENSCKRKKEVIEKIRSLAKSAQNWKEANKEFNALLEEFNNIYYYDQETENKLKMNSTLLEKNSLKKQMKVLKKMLKRKKML